MNENTLYTVDNFIQIEKKDDKFIPIRVNTFDLKTFMETWYGLNVNEIPVISTEYKGINEKDAIHKLHTRPK